jgi:hypothetical protein
MKLRVEVVVLGREAAELLVGLQQQIFEILSLRIHTAPPVVFAKRQRLVSRRN